MWFSLMQNVKKKLKKETESDFTNKHCGLTAAGVCQLISPQNFWEH